MEFIGFLTNFMKFTGTEMSNLLLKTSYLESFTYSISFTYVQPNKAPLEYLVIARYGFYGDVIKGSEGYRWMGPKRYDFAGTMAFLKHRFLTT